MGKRSKQKGARGELQAVAFLQEWWRRLEPEARFVRTPRSGGWGVHAGAGFKARGDVMFDPSTCRLFPFSVEVKWRKVITQAAIEHFFVGQASPIHGYWVQCCDAATSDGLEPLLLFRGDRMPWRACYRTRQRSRTIVLVDHLVTLDPALFVKEAA